MKLDDLITLNDVLKTSQYVRLLRNLKTRYKNDLNTTRIKNQIIQDWKSGMKNRNHYDNLLSQLDVTLNDLID